MLRRHADAKRQTWRQQQTGSSGASDVRHGTFAVFLDGDFYVGSGNVAFLAALLPRPRPAVAFVLFNDVQHLQQVQQHTQHGRYEQKSGRNKHEIFQYFIAVKRKQGAQFEPNWFSNLQLE